MSAPRRHRYGLVARTFQRLGHHRWFAAFGSKVAPRVDRLLYRRTGGRLGATGAQLFPTMLLTTIGRKTGQRRTTPLLYVRDGDRFVVAGSNWGQPTPPAWALNLLANADAVVEVGRERHQVRARVATGEERERMWRALDEMWPAYATYRERAGAAGRDINVFVLEPRSATG